ncbi:hypothetical protein E2C01_063999 [Portunus trituberculatus]|uniref:Uncharacterized protein n=1 Tax=Portunus trituberculatus TaxID=210409 RepID=A0A5B7HKJ5_PORTR|nr:hypothetical protein [Portunus trituberculatus]
MRGVVGVEEPGLKKVSTPSDISWSSSTRSARPMGLVGARVFTRRGRALPSHNFCASFYKPMRNNLGNLCLHKAKAHKG